MLRQQAEELNLEAIAPGVLEYQWLHLVDSGLGEPIRIPLIIAKGRHAGPVVGLTAAIHGNELNGIPVLQKLFRELDVEQLSGTVVGALVLNVPGLLLEQRKFNDGTDLNRIAPGDPEGNVSEIYIHRLIDRLLQSFHYLIDLHTASFGRINSWYIRADMQHPTTARMAILQNPQIILHNEPNDGTFRGAAASMGIHAITLELRDPHVFQQDVIQDALVGIRNVLYDLEMIEGEVACSHATTYLCPSSQWLYTDEGGILEVIPGVVELVEAGAAVANVRDIFGHLIKTYRSREKGIVIGKSVNPVNQTGSRIIHLGRQPQAVPCSLEVLTEIPKILFKS